MNPTHIIAAAYADEFEKLATLESWRVGRPYRGDDGGERWARDILSRPETAEFVRRWKARSPQHEFRELGTPRHAGFKVPPHLDPAGRARIREAMEAVKGAKPGVNPKIRAGSTLSSNVGKLRAGLMAALPYVK